MLVEHSVQEMLNELASAAPTPGGGSAAALAGALAAGLVSMVCNLTVGKRRYRSVEADMRSILGQAESCRERLTWLIQRDMEVYSTVMAAYRLPSTSSEERLSRQLAWQAALQEAADVPLQIAECCQNVVQLATDAARMGNTWAVSDAGAAASLALAGAQAASLSIEVNVRSMEDGAAAEAFRSRIERILAEVGRLAHETHAIVEERMEA